mmetsp:Transcript_16628/g.52039  ORF Transcript_16628/g.52039 Transcript_16628/m.52039 type:complete len:287 (-) Transcript_16628:342-1202(-)
MKHGQAAKVDEIGDRDEDNGGNHSCSDLRTPISIVVAGPGTLRVICDLGQEDPLACVRVVPEAVSGPQICAPWNEVCKPLHTAKQGSGCPHDLQRWRGHSLCLLRLALAARVALQGPVRQGLPLNGSSGPRRQGTVAAQRAVLISLRVVAAIPGWPTRMRLMAAQQHGHVLAATQGRDLGGRPGLAVPDCGVRARKHQPVQGVHKAQRSRLVRRCVPHCVPPVRARLRIQEQPHDGRVAVAAGPVQGRAATGVGRVRSGPALDQAERQLCRTTGAAIVQGGAACVV